MDLTKAKPELVDLKDEMSLNSKLDVMDAMLLIKTAWDTRFSRIETNKKAI